MKFYGDKTNLIQKAGWDKISPLYRNSAFTTLDPKFALYRSTEAIEPPSVPTSPSTATSATPSSDRAGPSAPSPDRAGPNAASDAPSPDGAGPSAPSSETREQKSRLGVAYVRNKLKAINNLVFLIDEQPDAITELGKALDQIESQFRKKVPTECGLPLRSVNGRSETWRVKRRETVVNPLPLRKKKKTENQRVGARADRIKKEKKILLEAMKEPIVGEDTVQETVPIDCLDIGNFAVDQFEV